MAAAIPSEAAPVPKTATEPSICGWAALVVAVLAVGGSLILSLGLGLRACPLCFYQRAFALSLVAVLGVGLVGGIGGRRLSLVALPLAVAGLGVAAFHVWLEVSGRLECPAGLLGLGSAPQQSLAVFAVMTALLLGGRPVAWLGLGAVLVGGLLALASCVANPPMPAPPTRPYDRPPEVCRPPFPATP